ncbi:hypothetical protein SUGI_0188220 [Cryptomeria japonica]|uniref:uncharacterized protein LOC131064286 n=1 Tax=Cryptomeria japonica TaxID=3369 RepID=UPI002408E567|nr:uncharacterized protein LOC131064286 [Cryptomeria japonica]GLJ12296.1 hypothetical protein SUGI_0188220 [Cryptomeria japonica]
MVLWEITLATAYVLGLKRTYRLALKLQRRLIKPRHPRIRDFVHRRTRNIFDVALTVHRKVQERDIEVGRNFGNWILRFLDRIKPSANIRGDPPCTSKTVVAKVKPSTGINSTSARQLSGDREAGRSLFVTSKQVSRIENGHFTSLSKYREKEGFHLCSGLGISSLPKMTHHLFWQPVRQNLRTLGSCIDGPFYASLTSRSYSKQFSRGVIREDIAAWMQH